MGLGRWPSSNPVPFWSAIDDSSPPFGVVDDSPLLDALSSDNINRGSSQKASSNSNQAGVPAATAQKEGTEVGIVTEHSDDDEEDCTCHPDKSFERHDGMIFEGGDQRYWDSNPDMQVGQGGRYPGYIQCSPCAIEKLLGGPFR